LNDALASEVAELADRAQAVERRTRHLCGRVERVSGAIQERAKRDSLIRMSRHFFKSVAMDVHKTRSQLWKGGWIGYDQPRTVLVFMRRKKSKEGYEIEARIDHIASRSVGRWVQKQNALALRARDFLELEQEVMSLIESGRWDSWPTASGVEELVYGTMRKACVPFFAKLGISDLLTSL
jgi:hypothetical protein